MSARRSEIVAIAAELFAAKGYASTTVREIADAAGILSGSLYHHFDSKESMIEALLRDFLERIDAQYRDVLSAGEPRSRRCARSCTPRSARSHDRSRRGVGDARRVQRARALPALRVPPGGGGGDRAPVGRRAGRGHAGRRLRADVPASAVYRFMRDAIWVSVRWFRPDGPQRAADVAEDYLAVLLGGLAEPEPRRSP